MRLLPTAIATFVLLGTVATLSASGPLGIYGIVERVVFEPSEQAPQRIQIWGAFAYADPGTSSAVTPAKRGYFYFSNPGDSEIVKKEWRDLKAVAGTGQAVGFGAWIYIGSFSSLEPDRGRNARIYPMSGGDGIDLRIQPETELPAAPAPYLTASGLVKLPADGNLGAIVESLKKALRR